jgi:hypothetical protein
MKITLQQLQASTAVERVVIHSVDCSLYIAKATVAGVESLVTDGRGKTLKTRNLLDMKQHLVGVPVAELLLHQQSAYDEMVGQPVREAENTLEVSLSPVCYPPPDWQH